MRHRIAVIYNEPKHTPVEEHWLSRSIKKGSDDSKGVEHSESFRDSSEFGVIEQMNSIALALEASGHEVLTFSADDDVMRLCNFLDEKKPEVIFNCCESILGQSALEMNVAAVYELFGIAYTGSPALTLGLALDKSLTKDLLLANGISTPRHLEIREGARIPQPEHLEFPLIVKPTREDASIGIDDHSIVHSLPELRNRVAFVHKEFHQAALVEEYIEGRELNIGMIGSPTGFVALPISEISFEGMPEGAARIVSYEAKWVEESPLYKTTVAICPAPLDTDVAREASDLALRAAQIIGLRDYGRVDMRMRERDGKLFVLEANPNPDISEDAGFMRAARESGRSFSGTINEIVSLAIERTEKQSR